MRPLRERSIVANNTIFYQILQVAVARSVHRVTWFFIRCQKFRSHFGHNSFLLRQQSLEACLLEVVICGEGFAGAALLHEQNTDAVAE